MPCGVHRERTVSLAGIFASDRWVVFRASALQVVLPVGGDVKNASFELRIGLDIARAGFHFAIACDVLRESLGRVVKGDIQ